MSARTNISWCDASWNPIVGCTRVSAGCEHCYAERFAHRWRNIDGHALGGLTRPHGGWNGVVRLNEKALDLPLRWRKPRRIFVDSMSDLFHEALPYEQIDRVFCVISVARALGHVFQILTKRPERMLDYMRSRVGIDGVICGPQIAWPLPNVWLGVSIEDQKTADERIPMLLATPAAKRFVSYEPALGPVNLSRCLKETTRWHVRADVEGMLRHRSFDCLTDDAGKALTRREAEDNLYKLHARGVKYIPASKDCDDFDDQKGCLGHREPKLDWVIAGGESGPHARPCDIGWIRSVVEQCREAGVACFVKQLGARPLACAAPLPWPQSAESIARHGEYDPDPIEYHLRSRAGSDPAEWPESLRVQEFPA